MNDTILPRSELTAADESAMYRLFAEHFLGTSPAQFRQDLDDKSWVVLLRDERGSIRGFSTIDCYDEEYRGERVTVIYSGDTIVDPAATTMGSALSRAWIGAVNYLRDCSAGERMYWLLLVSGYRTYRFLPLYWRRFSPHHALGQPPEERALRDHLAHARFGAWFSPSEGIVRFPNPQVLRPKLNGIPARKMHDPHIRFFAERNPGYQRGDELVCVTELAYDNLTEAGRRMWHAALATEAGRLV